MNAEALELQGKWDAAAREYEWIMKQFPSVPESTTAWRAYIFPNRTRTQVRVRRLRKNCKWNWNSTPEIPAPNICSANWHAQAAQWDEAIDHLSRATKLDPSFADAYLRLGMSRISAGKFPDAIPSLETYVKMQPTNPRDTITWGWRIVALGEARTRSARAALQKATAEKVEQEKLGKPPAPSSP